MKVIYNGIVISNEDVRNTLDLIDQDLLELDVIVTGGDRWVDSDGTIRSSSNGNPIPGSAKYSTHIEGLGVDFKIPGISLPTEFFEKYFDWVKDDYPDGHVHGDLRSKGQVCSQGKRP